MRFSAATLLVLGGCFLGVARGAELAASSETISLATQAQSFEIRELLVERQGCQAGFGHCQNTGSCCPLGGDCCSNGRCCGRDQWCYTSEICCPRSSNGCSQRGCCPQGSNCCADGRCCPSGSYCYRSNANGGLIRCCPNGKACA